MRPLDAQDRDPTLDTGSVRPNTTLLGTAGKSTRRLSLAVATTLALAGTEVANADIIVLPVGVDSISLSGNVYGPALTGGPGVYSLVDINGTEFTGGGTLGKPIEGQIYTLLLEAMNTAGEKFNMTMVFDNLQFTGDHYFQAFGTPVSNQTQKSLTNTQEIPSVYGSFDVDNDGYGEASVHFGSAIIASSVPEPGSGALALTGLGVLGGLAARRRKAGSPSSTPTETAPTPEGATIE